MAIFQLARMKLLQLYEPVFDKAIETAFLLYELTKEQKYLLVDYYVKWRIENIAKYYTTTGGYEQRAESEARVTLTGAERLIPNSAGQYDIRLLWEDVDGRWLLRDINWQPVR